MSLHFYFGAMNGGKSTLLLQTAHTYTSKGFEVILVGHGDNTREDGISSRIGLHSPVHISVNSDTNLIEELNNLLKNENWNTNFTLAILVDEAQFLTKKQVEQLLEFTIDSGVEVYCYGLKSDFSTHLFEGSKRLLELAEDIKDLEVARCDCGEVARVNARFNKSTGKLISSGPVTLIEGEVDEIIYNPVCNTCYLRLGGDLSV